MRWTIGIGLNLLIHSICLSQPSNAWTDVQLANWLHEQAIIIRSIDPSDTAFSDLEPLKKILQNVNVVMVGEPSHNDGAVFLAKSRLIKFLHEELNFNVLAFENDFYALDKSWDKIQNGYHATTELKDNLYWMWGESQQMKPLFEYIESVKSTNPLRITGFDVRVTGLANSKKYFLEELDSVISVIDPEFVKTSDYPVFRNNFKKVMTKEYMHGLTRDEETHLLEEIDKIEQLFLANRYQEIKSQEGVGWNYWFQLIQSTKSFCQNAFSYTLKDGGTFLDKYRNKYGNLRDIQMGKNALWLIQERFPDQKIILWGATYHFARNLRYTDSTEMSRDYSNKITAGDILWESVPNDIFTIGFTAYQGQMGNHYIDSREIGKASESSLEHHLRAYDYAFLDFREYRGMDRSPVNRLMRPLGYSEMKTNWADHIDGIFFIKSMTPSTGF